MRLHLQELLARHIDYSNKGRSFDLGLGPGDH